MVLLLIFSNYWMRLSRIWRIVQIKEGVIQRGWRPRWITPSKICRTLHILWKQNSIIALLFIQNIYSFLKEFCHYALFFFRTPNVTQPCAQVFSVNGSIICSGLGSIIFSGLHFCRHWFNMVEILSKFGEQQLVIMNYACSFNQSETGKYFEWIIKMSINFKQRNILSWWICFTHSTYGIKQRSWVRPSTRYVGNHPNQYLLHNIYSYCYYYFRKTSHQFRWWQQLLYHDHPIYSFRK